MTRNEIINEALIQLEAYGVIYDQGQRANFFFAWSRMLDQALDEYVNPFTVHFKEATANLVSGDFLYCPPDFKRIDQVFAKKQNGDWRELHPGDNALLKTIYPDAFTDPKSGDPTHYITQGVNNQGILYPRPNYNQAAGIRWEGYGNLLREDWPNPTSNCPLKRMYQPHLITGLCAKMCRTNPALAESFRMEFLRQQAIYNTDVNAYTRWARNRTGYGYPDGSRVIAEDPFNG